MWHCSERFWVSIFIGCSLLHFIVCLCWYISKGVDIFILMSSRFEINLGKDCLKLALSLSCFRVWKRYFSRITMKAELWTVVDQIQLNHSRDAQTTYCIGSINLALCLPSTNFKLTDYLLLNKNWKAHNFFLQF